MADESNYTVQRGAIRLQVEGLDTLKKKLEDLPKRIENRVIRKTLRTGANFFRRKIRANVKALRLSPTARRTLSRNVLVRVDRTRSGNFIARVLIKKPNRRTNVKEDAFFWRWIEYGTVMRFRETVEVGGAAFGTLTRYRRTTTSASPEFVEGMAKHFGMQGGARGYTGRVVAQPFVRPAIKDGTQEAVEQMIKVAEEEIAKVLAEEGFKK